MGWSIFDSALTVENQQFLIHILSLVASEVLGLRRGLLAAALTAPARSLRCDLPSMNIWLHLQLLKSLMLGWLPFMFVFKYLRIKISLTKSIFIDSIKRLTPTSK